MRRVADRCLVLVLVGGLLLVGGATQRYPVESKDFGPAFAQSALTLVGTIPAGKPAGIVVTCAGYNCAREHDIAYYDLSRDAHGRSHIRFADAATLQPVEETLPVLAFLDDGPLLYDPFYNQVYAFDSRGKCDAYGGNCYQQAWLHILADRELVEAVAINDIFNGSRPVDRFYHIEGVAIKPHGADARGGTTLIVDNTPNGNLDIVHISPDGQDVAGVERFSYRASTCGATQCQWIGNFGNSLALDYHRGRLYLADNNGPEGKVRTFRFGPNVHSEGAPIDVAQPALCFVHLHQVAVAQHRDRLYVPTGCQASEFGSTVLVETEFSTVEGRLDYRYGDQGIFAVDPHDPRRAFLTTSDRTATYDPAKWLTLHMLYDDVVVASLPLLRGYQTGWLRAMTFDPASNRLFLALNDAIYVVAVGGVPPAEMWPAPVSAEVTPDGGGTLRAGDGSAAVYVQAGSVDRTILMTYAEGPPAIGRNAVAAPGATTLHAIRHFELTAVISGTATPLDAFNTAFRLDAVTTPRERAGIIPGTLALYWWDGGAWVAQPTVGSGETLFTASSHLGRFALMGQSHAIYLPLVQR
jgi:hypothetical protein